MLMVRLATGDIMSKIWFTSDLHFGHEKEFLYGPRGYNNNEEMMQDIVRKWNNKVAVEDDITLGYKIRWRIEAVVRCLMDKCGYYLIKKR